MTKFPLIVDLDGTLIRSDLLIESALTYIKSKPFRTLNLLRWLAGGKANLKTQLADAVSLDVKNLPYNAEVLSYIQSEKAAQRQIVLATSSHRKFADQVAAHLDVFDDVLATDKNVNLTGHAKSDALVGRYGPQGFDYVGNSRDDLPVWAVARKAYAVDPPSKVEAAAATVGNLDRIFRSDLNPLKAWLKVLRLHQWTKNLLVFVPLFASHQLADLDLVMNAFIAFVVFGLCASSVYLLNDLVDLADDRQHATKRLRSFASGALSLLLGIVAIPIFLGLALAGSLLLLPWNFTAVLGAYYVLTAAYSFGLKRLVIVDVTVLALLYTLRIIAGAFAVGVAPTFWMLAFSMFIFFSFAMSKRCTELRTARDQGITEKSPGRGYYPDDMEMISALGASSGYIAVLVLALYIHDTSTVSLYRYPEIIWLACPLLLFWISRLWLLTHRGLMDDDPVLFAIRDRVSWGVGALFGCVFWLAA